MSEVITSNPLTVSSPGDAGRSFSARLLLTPAHGIIAGMKDVVASLEERLAAAPFAGTLTSDELAAVAEAEAEFANGLFTVDAATVNTAAVDDNSRPTNSTASYRVGPSHTRDELIAT